MQDTYLIECDDDTLKEHHALYKWSAYLEKASDLSGRTLRATQKYKDWMIEAGFEEVTVVKRKWPLNPWPNDRKLKELGAWNQVNMQDGVQGITLALFTRVLGMPQAEVEVFLADVRKDMRDRSVHSYLPM